MSELLLAKIGKVRSSDYSATLIFDGQPETEKYYKYNMALSLSAGYKVVVAKISGTYVILCRIK